MQFGYTLLSCPGKLLKKEIRFSKLDSHRNLVNKWISKIEDPSYSIFAIDNSSDVTPFTIPIEYSVLKKKVQIAFDFINWDNLSYIFVFPFKKYIGIESFFKNLFLLSFSRFSL